MNSTDLNWITNFIWGIADDVTGKLDVRAAAAKLPDEAQDQEPLEPDTDDVGEPEDAEPEEALAKAEA